MKSKKNVKTKKYLLIRKRKILKNKEKKRTLIPIFKYMVTMKQLENINEWLNIGRTVTNIGKII